MGIQVIKPGILTTIQDRGRVGYQKYGVNISGAMDISAARVANILIGNDENEPVLEMTLSGTTLKFTKDHMIAICGGNMTPYINNYAVPMWQPLVVKEGSTLSFAKYTSGCRVYLAIAGGFSVPSVLGSSSTFIRASLGGLNGSALKAGDQLEVKPLNEQAGGLSKRLKQKLQGEEFIAFNAQHFAMALDDVTVIRYIPGPEYEWLAAESKQDWLNGIWKIDAQSDRMGYRLQGAPLKLATKQEMISEGTVHGTIQLPANGQPIVLLSDRQTTGGYPRIATVVSVDIPMFGQLKPGDRISFMPVTLEEAENLLLSYEHDMDLLKTAITLKAL